MEDLDTEYTDATCYENEMFSIPSPLACWLTKLLDMRGNA